MPDDRQVLFDTYKLHTELAERVAALREGLNKLYTSVVTSTIAASVILYRLFPDAESVWVLPVLGIVVSLSWSFSLHSVTGRLSAKHEVLLILEEKLPFNFLHRENELFNKKRFLRRKYSGLVMPGGFLILSSAWLTVLLMRDFCSS